MSIHMGFWFDFLPRDVRGDLFPGLLVKITKKDLTRRGKHPNLSSVCVGRGFLFVVSNKNKRGIYLIS